MKIFEIFDHNSINISIQSAYLITKVLSNEMSFREAVNLYCFDNEVQDISISLLNSIEQKEKVPIDSSSFVSGSYYIIEIERHIDALIRKHSKIDNQKGKILLHNLNEIKIRTS